jgi:hypothetical protein
MSLPSAGLQSPAHGGSSLADFSTLKMEAIVSSETSIHTRTTRHHVPEDGILQDNFYFSFSFRFILKLYLAVIIRGPGANDIK